MQTVNYTTKPCPFCGKRLTMRLPKDGYDRWKAGKFVQQAFSGMSGEDRELLISGTDAKCWNKYMNFDED